MSARVVSGLVPAGKPHPTTKWSLLMALLVVVGLGMPGFASAGPPTVQSPTGPQSGGVFTGTYTFGTYIQCGSGFSFGSSYSNNLEGTHTFNFNGSTDGSLLVSIDGGGLQLITSCGDPLTGGHSSVGSFTVTKYDNPPTPSPTPTPTPAPTHTPTPAPTATPVQGGGGTTGNGGGHSSGGASGPAATPGPTPVPAGSTPPPAAAGTAPATSASPTTTPTAHGIRAALSPASRHTWQLPWGWVYLGLGLLGLIGAWLVVRRIPPLRERLDRRLTVLALCLEPYLFRLRHALSRRVELHGRHEPKRRGLTPHRHSGKVMSGKVMAHHHTSYPALAFLLLISTVLAAAVSMTSKADSSLLTLTVAGAPPAFSGTIDQPTNGQHFATNSQTVRGTCASGVFVEIWRGGAFAGSTVCDVNGLYAVLITLVPGQNDLVARVSDALGQYGPDSGPTTVYYDAPPPPTPTPTPIATATPTPTPVITHTPSPTPRPTATPRPTKSPARPSATPAPIPSPAVPALLLASDRHFYQASGTDQPVELSLHVTGGFPPYNLTWQWGDRQSDTTFAQGTGAVKFEHRYSKPGTFQVTVRVKDRQGQESLLQLVAIVNGTPGSASLGQASAGSSSGNLVFVWPLITVTALVLFSFWLGEHHVVSVLRPVIKPS